MQAGSIQVLPGRVLEAGVATNASQLLAAQRLRYDVFSAEYGADLDAHAGLDSDRFDDHCIHFIVRDVESSKVVATSRLLLDRDITETDGFYSETEFELAALKATPGSFAELGRTCVHPDYRRTSALSQLWSAVYACLLENDVDYLIGCASISMIDGGHRAWMVAQQLQQHHLVEPQFVVQPRRELPHIAFSSGRVRAVAVPPLIRIYLKLGAQVCGRPCWDPSFRCADLLMLLRVGGLGERHARRFRRS
ncbi:GNAT family N-acetyltransferase [Hydrocarboniclastica marina]|uniref:L-ornithine N(alpha)-acyltransferase n=1 Tax=Hydrocarboniclastica marina TaxID=2259620 RepID=A0A4P7XGB5_9ALTE|nr:GNAT family N-acyltransferase [Hydrocarboniclastica marina]QCF26031.1 GNAT family N-acetyltransferase [Hydrocarboniclastica marina]